MTGLDALTAKIERSARRTAQLQAQRALREMRLATIERVRARKRAARQRYELGDSVLLAGLVDWQAAELVGLLLDGKDRFGASPTMRMGLRKRGEEHLMGALGGGVPASH